MVGGLWRRSTTYIQLNGSDALNSEICTALWNLN